MLQRLDIYLVEKHFFESRRKAQNAITQKLVKINGLIIDKPSTQIQETDKIEIIAPENQFVSRGGLKLQKAIFEFNLDFNAKTVLDIGASTGGFTDCALQNGALKVFAIDVGTNQLHKNLCGNPKIVSLENTNIKDLTLQTIDNKQVDIIVADVSFTSITKVFEYLPKFLKDDGQIVILIKPQFEAGQQYLSKTGIVKNKNAHIKILKRISEFCNNHDFYIKMLTNSTIYTNKKNIEYLTLISKQKSNLPNIQQIVNNAFEIQKSLK